MSTIRLASSTPRPANGKIVSGYSVNIAASTARYPTYSPGMPTNRRQTITTIASTRMNPSMVGVARAIRATMPDDDSFWNRTTAAAQASGSTVGRSRRTTRAATRPTLPAARSPREIITIAQISRPAAANPPTAIQIWMPSSGSTNRVSTRPISGATNRAR